MQNNGGCKEPNVFLLPMQPWLRMLLQHQKPNKSQVGTVARHIFVPVRMCLSSRSKMLVRQTHFTVNICVESTSGAVQQQLRRVKQRLFHTRPVINHATKSGMRSICDGFLNNVTLGQPFCGALREGMRTCKRKFGRPITRKPRRGPQQ